MPPAIFTIDIKNLPLLANFLTFGEPDVQTSPVLFGALDATTSMVLVFLCNFGDFIYLQLRDPAISTLLLVKC
jgi:hypothetical protein